MKEIAKTEKILSKTETRIVVTEFYDQVIFDVPGGRIEKSQREVEGVLIHSTLNHNIENERLYINPNGIKSCRILKDNTYVEKI